MQTGSRNQGQTGWLGQFAQAVFSPATSALNGLADGIGDFASGVFDAGSLRSEVRRLRAFEQTAVLYGDTLRRYENEVIRLREMLKLPPTPGKAKIAASVVGYFPLESRATLSVGSDKGIKKGMPVVATEGLMGIVQSVNPSTCQVLLISSAQLRLVGMVQRDPAPVGFVRGLSDGAMVFEVLDAKSVVQNGDRVVTSGFSETVPAGIPIGHIVQIEEDVAFGSRRCQVFPGAQIGSIREVFVLR
jgi:rod shape-determining protein MreC